MIVVVIVPVMAVPMVVMAVVVMAVPMVVMAVIVAMFMGVVVAEVVAVGVVVPGVLAALGVAVALARASLSCRHYAAIQHSSV